MSGVLWAHVMFDAEMKRYVLPLVCVAKSKLHESFVTSIKTKKLLRGAVVHLLAHKYFKLGPILAHLYPLMLSPSPTLSQSLLLSFSIVLAPVLVQLAFSFHPSLDLALVVAIAIDIALSPSLFLVRCLALARVLTPAITRDLCLSLPVSLPPCFCSISFLLACCSAHPSFTESVYEPNTLLQVASRTTL
jgi:hypothetical protein